MTIDGYRAEAAGPMMTPTTYGALTGLVIGTVGMLTALLGFRG